MELSPIDWVALVVPLLSGVVWILAGALSLAARRRLTGRAWGRVVRFRHRIKGPVAVIEFAVGERQVEFDYAWASSVRTHKVGERVRVLYDPSNPENAFVDSFAGVVLGPLIAMGLGALILLCCGLFVLGHPRAAMWIFLGGLVLMAAGAILSVSVFRRRETSS